MENLSQEKRKRMIAFLKKIKEEHKDDDETLIALDEIENELNSKKYGLVWEKHEEKVDRMMQDNIPVFTEVKEREIKAKDENSYNFLLEGDNLHSLKLLEKTHAGKIDVIYIDPPYNTGNKDFIYDDSFVDKNDGYAHSKWLSFMSERLEIAKRLLSDEGVIFISIDDNEQAQLKLMCDSVFDEENFVTSIHWKRSESQNNSAKQFAIVGEFILCYAIDKSNRSFNKIALQDTAIKEYRYVDEVTGKKFRRGTIVDNTRGKNIFDIVSPSGIKKRIKSIRNKKFFEEKDTNGEIYWTRTGTPYLKIFLDESEGQISNNWFDNVGVNEDASEQLSKLNIDFSFSKPTSLIIKLLEIAGNNKSIILDFFAGSGTTAHAVLELNKVDGGNRKFILCTNNENNICEEITYERIKRVIYGYSYVDKKKNVEKTVNVEGIPANLKYFKTDFIPKDADDVSEELLAHIQEMVELENGINIDNKHYLIILTDEQADELAKNWSNYEDVKAIYVSRNVLFTSEQNTLFRNTEIHTIPDYYFEYELKELGESW